MGMMVPRSYRGIAEGVMVPCYHRSIVVGYGGSMLTHVYSRRVC